MRLIRKGDTKKKQAEIEMAIISAINESAINIQRNAVRFAPVNKKVGTGGGFLKRGIVIEKIARVKDPSALVVSKAKYSPYQEFGTGTGVRVPPGYKAVAAKFRGSRKRKHNMSPQAFMIPAIEIERQRIEQRLKNKL